MSLICDIAQRANKDRLFHPAINFPLGWLYCNYVSSEQHQFTKLPHLNQHLSILFKN